MLPASIDVGRRSSVLSVVDAVAEADEVRIDPVDNCPMTLDEMRECYDGTYDQEEIDEYWDSCCRPVRKGEHVHTAGRGGVACSRRAMEPPLPKQRWEYELDSGSWEPFKSSDNDVLERHFTEDPDSHFEAYLGSQQWKYLINLGDRFQMNLETGMARTIRRVRVDEPTVCVERDSSARGFADLERAIAASLAHQDTAVQPKGSTEAHSVGPNVVAIAGLTLKVSVGSDTRRLRVDWPADASSAEVFSSFKAR